MGKKREGGEAGEKGVGALWKRWLVGIREDQRNADEISRGEEGGERVLEEVRVVVSRKRVREGERARAESLSHSYVLMRGNV